MASSRRSAGCIGTVRYQLTCVMLKTRYSSRRAGPRSIVTANKLALCAPGRRGRESERARAVATRVRHPHVPALHCAENIRMRAHFTHLKHPLPGLAPQSPLTC